MISTIIILFWLEKPDLRQKSSIFPKVKSQNTTCNTVYKCTLQLHCKPLADCEFIPADSRPLTSWGQRACLSSGPPLTWGKSPLARTAGVR